jgi:hypothetical protein
MILRSQPGRGLCGLTDAFADGQLPPMDSRRQWTAAP